MFDRALYVPRFVATEFFDGFHKTTKNVKIKL